MHPDIDAGFETSHPTPRLAGRGHRCSGDCGPRIHPREEDAMENLARYIIRASFSQERMTYIPEESKVVYQSKDGKQQKAFNALAWLAAMSCHIPDTGEQMVRYYGYYSNVCRGRRQKENHHGMIPYIIEQEENSKEYRRNWARLIRKIYEVDSLTCPKCQGTMKAVSFIEDKDVIEKILKHLGIRLVKKKPSARANAPPVHICLDYSDSQIPPSEDQLYKDPDYPIETHAS
jgi:hypothetical protein